MAPDIDAVKKLLQENKIWSAVQHHIAYYHAPQVCYLKLAVPRNLINYRQFYCRKGKLGFSVRQL